MLWLQGAENMKEQPKTTEKKRKLNTGLCSRCLPPQVSLFLSTLSVSLSLTQTDKSSLLKKRQFFFLERDRVLCTHPWLVWCCSGKQSGSTQTAWTQTHKSGKLAHGQISMHTCNKCTHTSTKHFPTNHVLHAHHWDNILLGNCGRSTNSVEVTIPHIKVLYSKSVRGKMVEYYLLIIRKTIGSSVFHHIIFKSLTFYFSIIFSVSLYCQCQKMPERSLKV